MTIKKVRVRNYRTLRAADVELTDGLNIIVGDNEAGKSTLLEAVNLALTCQLNRRYVGSEIHPFLFNVHEVGDFITDLRAGRTREPPSILIELYFADEPELADLRGTNNKLREDAPGVSLRICLDEDFREDYRDYVSDPSRVNSLPVEYYHAVWLGFDGNQLNARAVPLKSSLIDPSSLSDTYAANRYALEVVRDTLSKKEKAELALSYRHMRNKFLEDASVRAINEELKLKSDVLSDQTLSVAMDMTTRANWETGVLPHLNEIPLTLVGKGEQSAVKVKLALNSAIAKVLLMEEPENHLTHPNLNRLLQHVTGRLEGKQLLVTTHSSFVLNKLGIDHVLMFNGETAITLSALSASTKDYFRKLPGHDTLRMILAERVILVEGPSDELIVQKAYKKQNGTLPLEDGVEVISVGSLAFKRFLDIAKLLRTDVRVVTDNDGDPDAVAQKYEDYSCLANVEICFDTDEATSSLEQQLIKANGVDGLNAILGTDCSDEDSLLKRMTGDNKTATALSILDTSEPFAVPDYIQRAIE